MDNTLTRDTNYSSALGRAAAFDVAQNPSHSETRATNDNSNLDIQIDLRDAHGIREEINKINDVNSRQPIVSHIGLDLAFARIGSLMMMLKGILSFFISDEIANDPTKMNFSKALDDAFLKIRQLCQYSIHAQPGLSLRKPDDIASDMVHNMQAASLGKNVYVYNAFVAPWLAVFKMFFPYNENPIFGLLPRMVDFADNTVMKLTNIFWNFRRISKSIIPYDGGISSQSLSEKQSAVKELMSYYWKQLIVRPYNSLLKFFFKNNSKDFELLTLTNSSFDTQKILQIQKEALRDYWNNIKALVSKNYQCVHEEIPKPVGSEEPENARWYVRSRMFSQIFGLWAGSIGGIFNTLGIGINFLGSLFNIHPLRKLSDQLTEQANALMSVVYLTGEVPANINEYLKKKKLGEQHGGWNLVVAGIGALGTLNRIKANPLLGSLLNLVKVKPFLDKWDRLLKNCFLLFFSANRWAMHNDERNSALKNSSRHDIEIARKHETFWKHFTLPFRVLIKDPDVSYTGGEILTSKSNS